MALLHRAELTPSKIELLRDWIPSQPWCPVLDPDALELLGAYRFDDPDGEVGIETHLVGASDRVVLQVPLTYRATPLAGREASLIGTMQHSVLGRRFVHDGVGDPAYLAALASAILTGGTQAELHRQVDGVRETVPATAQVQGSGSADTEIVPADLEVVRVLFGAEPAGDHSLTGTWSGQESPVLLAVARQR